MDDNESVPRTLRIDKELDEALREDAERQGTSVNSLANMIFRQYALTQRYSGGEQRMVFHPGTVEVIMSKPSEEEVAEAGLEVGATRPRDMLYMRGLTLDFDSVLWFMKEILGGYNGWFYLDHYHEDGEHLFHLRHRNERKWSIFLANYMKSLFSEILEIDIDPVIERDYISFKIT
ncbi:MAG: hypothetical protein ACLFVP_03830 [Candidatus Bathyarchaeia archaeon]